MSRKRTQKTFDSIVDTIGNTPIVRLKRLERLYCTQTQLYAKLELFNPLGSVKDRIGIALIRDMQKKGKLKSNGVIVESTSGNAGIGIAFAAASVGLRSVIVISEGITLERKKMLFILGARVLFSSKRKGIKAANELATKFAERVPLAAKASQFENKANCEAHKRTTAKEILRDIGCVDYIVIGVGTGGTLTGVAEVVKRRCANTKIVAVEPWRSSVLSGKRPKTHRIQGIGAGFIPKILNLEAIDYVCRVKDREALTCAKLIARAEGIPVGPSSGAALRAGLSLAVSLSDSSKRVLMILPSFAEGYASTKLFKLGSAV
ncbi:MAG: Cysteine synthase [Candidatus Hodgkinia cicadicola]|nr:MAG: Cysteine synthase [Candidatus Hodgkinia cicadicola]